MILADSGNTAIEVMITASIVVPLVLLVIVGWIFWRAAQRDRHANM